MATAASAASARSSAGSSKQTKPSSTTTTSQKRDSASRHHSAAAAVVHVSGIAFNTPDQKQNLSQIDWKDKVLWGTRLILGGNSVNGFLRATATAQRIKKQRARQMIITKKAAAAAAGGPPPTAAAAEHNNNDDHKKDKSNKQVFDQEEEEKLKQDIMNPRTAKKIKAEMEAGVQFCATVHNILRSAIFEIALEQTPYLPKVLQVPDHPIQASSAILIPTPMSHATPQQGWTLQPQQQQASSSSSSLMMTHHDSSMPWAVKSNAGGPMGAFHFASKIPRSGPRPMSSSSLLLPPANKTTASPGNPEGSTLRKMRRKRLPPSNNDEPRVQLPELDGSGKRLCTKKEHHYRLFELLRFRPLRQGDFVAARLTSRDLWILAKVQNKDYPGIGMAPLDFLKLSGTRRDAVFREKVLVKDVEEKEDGGSAQVARSLTLPLPRTHSEAAEWGQR